MTTPPSDDSPTPPELTSPSCPSCGATIPADAPKGLCPACLAGAAAASAKTLPAGSGNKAAAFEVPEASELDVLLNDFEVSEMIGRGGMGAVYKARQIKLERTVAIKVLPESVAADAAFAERFVREAHALAQLSHPNVINVFDFGTTDEGLCYIVMEYVEGANLRAVLESGHLSPREALTIVVQICEALQYAHDKGIVHRDIKPENILLTESGVVKIADFGLVKLVGGNSPDFDVTLTATHQAMGTIQYMAPEQLTGSVDADHRADIYSLGVVFYEMLTGEIPAGRFDPPSQRVAVDVRLDEVVLRALDGQPDRRYQSASDVREEVESIRDGGGASQTPPPLGETSPPRATSGSQGDTTRFSRKAIVGALWAPLFFMAFMSTFMVSSARVVSGTEAPLPPASAGLWQWLAIVFIGLPGLFAPIGTTVLGIMAISDIRRSRGKIVGLPLAVADALLFPLLVLFAVIGAVAMMVFWMPADQPYAGWFGPVVAISALAVALTLSFFIVRATWRAAQKPVSDR